MGLHIGRSWPGMVPRIENECQCPQEPCGLVDTDKAAPDCPHHKSNKTIRQGHDGDDCPGHIRYRYAVKVEKDEKYFFLTFPTLREHSATQARTFAEIPVMARDYIALTLDIPDDSFDLLIEIDEQALLGDR